MHERYTNILDLEHLRIDFFETACFTGKLLYTFTEYSNRTMIGSGFAGKFAIDNGFDLIAFKSNVDDWYQAIPANTFDLIETFLLDLPRRHTFRGTYGSSMGGYAAVAFASELKADVVLALSPQFDISQGWDRRWAKQADKLGRFKTLEKLALGVKCKYFIAYDPVDADRLHFESFAKVIHPEILYPIKIKHAGHPVGYFLNATGNLQDIALSALGGSDVVINVKNIRQHRKNYPNYLFNLSRNCLRRGKINWAAQLIAKAIGITSLNSEFRIQAALIFETLGSLDEALAHASLAVALSPRHPDMLAALSRILHKKLLSSQALIYIDLALEIVQNEQFVRQRSAILGSIEASRLQKKL